VQIAINAHTLEGILAQPPGARAIVLFAARQREQPSQRAEPVGARA
jgi:hypothetical protein